ncbi:MAG: hypothetical protein MUF43_07810 [Flavobacterium sp.]|jgi:hypothetical protein|nr:hypothetical protein [Flavobacterium sp.]MCU0392925.1 hypothetical protein [Thermoflexibacter sp.]
MILELLKQICTELDKQNILYMVSGSLALNIYATPRMTRDIDIIIELAEQDIDKFMQIFKDNFYIYQPSVEEEVRRKGMFNVIDNRTGYKADFIILKDTEYRQLEFGRRKRNAILGFEAWIVAIEDLIISKLIWTQELQSNRQLEDIKNLLDNPSVDREYLKLWCKKLNLNTFHLF